MLVWGMALYGNATLVVIDSEGRPTSNQVAAGVPFRVELKLDRDNGTTTPEPAVFSPAVILGQSTQNFVAITNGKRSMSKSYIYTLRIDREGEYSLGPVQLKMPDRTIESSNKLALKVTKDIGKKNSEISITLQADTLKPFVGQEINLRLRLESSAPIIVEKNVTIEKNPVLEILPFQEPQQEKQSGILSVSWFTKAYAQTPGEITLPGQQVAYAAQRSGFMAFAPWQSVQAQYSNSLIFTVRALPPFDKKINAVGALEDITLVVPKKRVDHAAAVYLQVAGTSGLARFIAPTLVLPEGLKYYPGATHYEQGKKTVEYIIQAQEPGEYTIPSQEIIYFDINQEKYTALHTEPVTLVFTVAAPAKVSQEIIEHTKTLEKSENSQRYNEEQKVRLVAALSHVPEQPIKKHVLIIALLLPLFFGGLISAIRWYIQKTQRFRDVRNAIARANEEKNVASLAPVFIRLLDYPDIGALLASNSGAQQRWNLFFDRIQAAAYGEGSLASVHDIIREAYEWSAYFERNTR